MLRLKAVLFLASLLALGASLQPKTAAACDNAKKADVSTSSADKVAPPTATTTDAGDKKTSSGK